MCGLQIVNKKIYDNINNGYYKKLLENITLIKIMITNNK